MRPLLRPLYALAEVLFLRRFRVEGASMEPTLAHGDYLLVRPRAYRWRRPVRGDIVVVRDHLKPGREYVKRVVGLPGEYLCVREGRVWANDLLLDEPYLEKGQASASRRDGKWLLGPDEYFLLGDARDNSLDSRAFGPVAQRLIAGKVWLRYWPRRAWGRVQHQGPS